MKANISGTWLAWFDKAINELLIDKKPFTYDTKYKNVAQVVVARLIKINVPYKVLNMGVGITRITTDVDICPKCKGLGKC